MQRLSNRLQTDKSNIAPQVQYIDRIVEVPSKPEIQYVDREVMVEAPAKLVEPTQIIVNEEVDLTPIYTQIEEIKKVINHNTSFHNGYLDNLKTNQDMQSRALVALKQQRDIDRSRRLILIKRLRREQKTHKKQQLKLKIAMGASLLISIASLFIKL